MNGAVGGGRRIVAPRMEIVNGTTCYVFPVTGLKVEGAWNVGPVTISSGSAADEALVDGVPSLCRPGEPLDDVRRAVLDADTTADVVAASVAHALSLVREALDVLRVFYRVETSAVRTIGEFGLPGEVNSGYVPYLARPSHEGDSSTLVISSEQSLLTFYVIGGNSLRRSGSWRPPLAGSAATTGKAARRGQWHY